jgi:MFS transporter, SP family, arabinose:H+ symporter
MTDSQNREIRASYLLLLTATAALGGLLFGFDIAIITGAGPFIQQHFHLSELQLGWGFSSLLFGCIAGSAVAGRVTDIFGRRKILMFVAAMFAATSAGTALAPSFALFAAARFLGGLAVGAASVVSPMYISEVSPSHLRGRLVAAYQLSIVIGVLASYSTNYLLRGVGPANWRWMFLTGVAPSAAFLLLLFLVPETPRFLFKAGREAEAGAVLRKIGGAEYAAREMAQIRGSLIEAKNGFRELLRPELRKPMLVGIGLAVLVQMSGINTIIDYAPIIFKSAGWKIDAALFSTFIIGSVNFAFTLVSLWAIDRYGRKPLYLVGSAGMTVTLGILAYANAAHRFTGTPVLLLILAFTAFFAACIGPVFWTLLSEIFPNKIRGTAMSVPVFTQWTVNALIIWIFPWVFRYLGGAVTFGFLALMAFLQLLFTWAFVPETKNKSLEEIETAWGS